MLFIGSRHSVTSSVLYCQRLSAQYGCPMWELKWFATPVEPLMVAFLCKNTLNLVHPQNSDLCFRLLLKHAPEAHCGLGYFSFLIECL